MTNLLGSKPWISAVAATGAVVALSGCALFEPAGSASPSAATPAVSEAPMSQTPTAEPGATSQAAPDPASASASASPAASAPASEPAGESAGASASAGAVPSPSSSASASTPAAAGTCSAAQLAGAIEDQPGGGAAGSVYRTLVLTNASDQECVVDGYPGVSFVDASGTQIGAAAERDGAAAVPVALAPGGSVTTTLRQTNAQNYGTDCGITPATGLRIYPPGATDSLVLPQEIPACSATSIVLMTVGTLQPAS
ncbi:DUF4232 domain-containing protein [Arthrobacter burdickii]|uniref:DUF4232 domain-containing protein n=1 Tax=Arthrobacter burdickii TaxID=3035920 RepID=A0ABT8JVU7_9MICC|nr:DUF4232 domain-containing protein [Arthrobacter burdickii]MDN4609306.1 DUF4232 domain-containing protein [Arthrobacter burdickii]